jgi:hypothetical protein
MELSSDVDFRMPCVVMNRTLQTSFFFIRSTVVDQLEPLQWELSAFSCCMHFQVSAIEMVLEGRA